MIQITAQMRVLVAIEPVDGRKGIDSLVRLCQDKLAEDPFSGCVFVFRSRGGTTIRLLNYDGQGYWLAQKRLSRGRFIWWPESGNAAKQLEAYEALLLFAAGDVARVRAARHDCATQIRKRRAVLPVGKAGEPDGDSAAVDDAVGDCRRRGRDLETGARRMHLASGPGRGGSQRRHEYAGAEDGARVR